MKSTINIPARLFLTSLLAGLITASCSLTEVAGIEDTEDSSLETPAETPVATPTTTEIPAPTSESASVITSEPASVAEPSTPAWNPLPTWNPIPITTPEPTPVATLEPTPVATPEPTPVATLEPTPVATPEPTPVATPEPTPVATPEPQVALPVDETNAEFYGPKLTALSIDNSGDFISFSLEADSYASSMTEANLFIKNPNGEIQGIGCAPFFQLMGTGKGCTLNLQSPGAFWEPVGNYSWERLTLKNSYGSKSSYWGDGRLQKGAAAPIETNAHEFTSEKISFEKLFILKEPVKIGTGKPPEFQMVNFMSNEAIESSIESLSTIIDLTLYNPVPTPASPSELQVQVEAETIEIEASPEVEVIPQAEETGGYSEESHLLYAPSMVKDHYEYGLVAPNEDGKLRKTMYIMGADPETGLWGSLGVSSVISGTAVEHAGNTHSSWKVIEENWPADLEFDSGCQWTKCIHLDDNSFLTLSGYASAAVEGRPINFGDRITEFVKRGWGKEPGYNVYTFTGTKGQYFEIDASVPENSNTQPELYLQLTTTGGWDQYTDSSYNFSFDQRHIADENGNIAYNPNPSCDPIRKPWEPCAYWDGERKLGTKFSKSIIGTLPEDGTYSIKVLNTVQKGAPVLVPSYSGGGGQLATDIDASGTSVTINIRQVWGHGAQATLVNGIPRTRAINGSFLQPSPEELIGSSVKIGLETFKITDVIDANTVSADRAQDGTTATKHDSWANVGLGYGEKIEYVFNQNHYGEKITVNLSQGGVRVVKPIAPTLISTELVAGSVKATWSAPTMDIDGRSNPIIDSYTVGARSKKSHGTLESRANDPGITITAEGNATSAIINGLTSGLPYYIYVTANNEKGSSAAANSSNTITPLRPSPFSYYANSVDWDNTGQATYLRETKFWCPDPNHPMSLQDFCDPSENGPQTYNLDCGTPLTTIMDPNSVKRSLVGYDGEPVVWSWEMDANSNWGTSRVPGKVGQDLLLNYSLYPTSIPSYAGCVNSEITVDGEIDEWPFEGKAGQWVEITMDPTYLGDKRILRSPGFDTLTPLLELVAPNPPPGSVPFSKLVAPVVPVGEDISCYAHYCSSGEISSGETKGGYIDTMFSTDIWKFEAIKGEKYTIVIEFNPNLGIASEKIYGQNYDTNMPLSPSAYHKKHGPLATMVYGVSPDPVECWPLDGNFSDPDALCPKRANGVELGGPQSIFMWANNNGRREYNDIQIATTGPQKIHISANSSWLERDCSTDPCATIKSGLYDGAGFPVYKVTLTKIADAPELWNERPSTIPLDLLKAGYTGEYIEYGQGIDSSFEVRGEVDSYHFYGKAGESVQMSLSPTKTHVGFFDRFAVNGDENEFNKTQDCLTMSVYVNERRDEQGKVIHDGTPTGYTWVNPCIQTVLQLVSPSGTLAGYNSGPKMGYSGNPDAWPNPAGMTLYNPSTLATGVSVIGIGRPVQLKETGWYTIKGRALDVQTIDDLSVESSSIIDNRGLSNYSTTGNYRIALKQLTTYVPTVKKASEYASGVLPRYVEDDSGTICPRTVHMPNTSQDANTGEYIIPHDNCVAFAQNTLSFFGNPINQPLVIRHRLTQDGTYIIKARGTSGKATVWDGRVEGGNTGTYRLSLLIGDIAPQDDPDYGKTFYTPNENIDFWQLFGVAGTYVCPWTESCGLWDAKLPTYLGLQPVGNTSQFMYGQDVFLRKPGQLATYPIHSTPIPISTGESIEVSFKAPGCSNVTGGTALEQSKSGCYDYKVPTKGYDIQYPDDVFELTYQGSPDCIQCFVWGGYLSFEGVKDTTINIDAIWNKSLGDKLSYTENPMLELISPSLKSEAIDFSGSNSNWKTSEGQVISMIESHVLMETGTYRIKVHNAGHRYGESEDGPILATVRLS